MNITAGATVGLTYGHLSEYGASAARAILLVLSVPFIIPRFLARQVAEYSRTEAISAVSAWSQEITRAIREIIHRDEAALMTITGPQPVRTVRRDMSSKLSSLSAICDASELCLLPVAFQSPQLSPVRSHTLGHTPGEYILFFLSLLVLLFPLVLCLYHLRREARTRMFSVAPALCTPLDAHDLYKLRFSPDNLPGFSAWNDLSRSGAAFSYNASFACLPTTLKLDGKGSVSDSYESCISSQSSPNSPNQPLLPCLVSRKTTCETSLPDLSVSPSLSDTACTPPPSFPFCGTPPVTSTPKAARYMTTDPDESFSSPLDQFILGTGSTPAPDRIQFSLAPGSQLTPRMNVPATDEACERVKRTGLPGLAGRPLGSLILETLAKTDLGVSDKENVALHWQM